MYTKFSIRQYKCTLSFQKNKGGDTPKIKSGGTQKLKDDIKEIIKENKKEDKDDEQDIDDEIEKLLSTKNNNNEDADIEDILSEHESTHLSAEAENVIITLEKKENVVIKEKRKDKVISNKESEDTILYSGDCNLEEASPSFFDKLKADDDMKDDDFDSDLDFDEDIFNEETVVSNKKNEIPKPNMEDKLRSPGKKDLILEKKEEADSSQTALSDDSSQIEKMIIKEKTPKRDLFNFTKKIKNNAKSDDSDDEKREKNSPFTIPISTASPFTSSPQKKKKDNLVDLDDSASNTLSLTPIKNTSPQPHIETRLFIGEGDTGESATLPMDVPSPSSNSSNPSSNKRKNENNSGNVGNNGDSSPFSPKKVKPNKRLDPFDDDATPSHSPLVKFDSPRSKSVSPHKPKKGYSSNNLNGKDNRSSPNSGGIKKKDLSLLFSASDSLDAPTEGDSLVKITQKEKGGNHNENHKEDKSEIKKSRKERGIDIDEGSHEMTELSEMDDYSDVIKNIQQKESSRGKEDKEDKKEDFVEEKYTNENNSSNFISSNKQSLFNSFNSKHNDSPGELSPYQEDYLDDVFGDVAPSKLDAKGFESDNLVLSKSANLSSVVEKKKVEKEIEKKSSKKKKTPVSSPLITPKTKKKSTSPKPQKKKKNSKATNEKSPDHDSFLDFISSRKVQNDKNDSPYKVMFTGITDKKREDVIKKLGGLIVDNFEKGCSHLITNKIRLTNKFLCGISLTEHIVDIKWVDECKKQGKFVDEEDFVLTDNENEGKWKFSLKESIDKSKHHKKLLSELSVYSTPNLLSANTFISEMVHAHGGTFLENPPKSYDKSIIVLSSKEDLQSVEFLSLSRINFKIYSLEFFLISVLKQELLFKNYSPLNL
eukprot:TRINITY_DN2123_c0_g1_i7.p1 TRINITY_DN2123_c0_g1~~TRINITY_DN2123_c0_g1_i7.p1  ORF type:complete len:877 (-),score=365.99 TRINITY_DN2123_c0_g1_i7:155-2785(-)